MSVIFYSHDEKRVPFSQPKIGLVCLNSLHPMANQDQKQPSSKMGATKIRKIFFHIFLALLAFSSLSCSSKPQTGLLIRDPIHPPKVVQEAFAKEGKSDYFLVSDEGYSFRLIYLCENRVLNFIEEPPRNPILVSIQPILDTPVENRLSPDDRRRIWACMERKVWEEKSRIEEFKSRIIRERTQVEKEVQRVGDEKERILAENLEKKRLEAERQRRIEQEKRRAEEERLRKVSEEQRRIGEEERKLRYYRTGEREDYAPPRPLPPLKITESGVFLAMKEARVQEEPRHSSKVLSKAEKYDLFEVINSNRDESGNQWHQIILGERVISDKGKKYGWSPEERSFWVKNKLLAWVYPGNIENTNNIKPLKIRIDDIQFTGKTAITPQKITYYEVSYGIDTSSREVILGWVEESNGIRRSTKTKEEMRNLLNDLSKTLWPIRIQEDVLKGYIRQGFTREQVVLSWGRPDHVNTTQTLVGVHEQWVYGEPPFPKSYVYFENGLVKSWEFFKDNGK